MLVVDNLDLAVVNHFGKFLDAEQAVDEALVKDLNQFGFGRAFQLDEFLHLDLLFFLRHVQQDYIVAVFAAIVIFIRFLAPNATRDDAANHHNSTANRHQNRDQN